MNKYTLKLQIRNQSEQEADRLIKQFTAMSQCDEVDVTAEKIAQWPDMTLGDTFLCKDQEYVFVSKEDHGETGMKARCFLRSALEGRVTGIQPVFFSMIRTEYMKFNK